jgi:hypothetical protein
MGFQRHRYTMQRHLGDENGRRIGEGRVESVIPTPRTRKDPMLKPAAAKIHAAVGRMRLATRFRRPRCPIASVASKSATRAGVCATVSLSKRRADKDTARHPGDWKTPMRWVRFLYRGGRLGAPWVAENAFSAADHPATAPEPLTPPGRRLAQRKGLDPADWQAWPTANASWLTHAGLFPCG